MHALSSKRSAITFRGMWHLSMCLSLLTLLLLPLLLVLCLKSN